VALDWEGFRGIEDSRGWVEEAKGLVPFPIMEEDPLFSRARRRIYYFL